ncbi:hypothetical protein [Megamonas sp.]|uniref:hypothetical protein n=1 Tax=Megamonas sp. TaxID=2049033 RepID=UPI00258CC427|nr:hypothetical protein [Megamonas sp.]
MSEYIKGNKGLIKWSVVEAIVVRGNEVYAIYKDKEILISKCRYEAEAESFLNDCIVNIEEKNTIQLQNPISLIEKKY